MNLPHRLDSQLLRLGLVAFLSCLAILWLGWPAQGLDTQLAVWVEMGPQGRAIARIATPDAQCPAIDFDSRPSPMQLHAAPNSDFPVRVCEQLIPVGTQTAKIQGQSLPLPNSNPQRILVIGDTGCRLKGLIDQACNQPQSWPFKQLADQAAAWNPDLVIHVGDYYYRERACAADQIGCAGSPWGDNWPTWQAELIDPAAQLLKTAPWVFVRGNHELCDRGGGGWFHLLEPRSLPDSCEDYSPPYVIPLEKLQLLVLDTSAAADTSPRPEQVAIYAQQFRDLPALAPDPTWVLTHRPIWAAGQTPTGELFRTNPTLQAALNNHLPEGVKSIFSGHLHLFELLSFKAKRSPQWVVGNGGTLLDPILTTALDGLEIGSAKVKQANVLHRFGYLALTARSHGWDGEVYNPSGEVIRRCRVDHRQAHCQP
jgi:Calcineurin-like phosphoesterase